MGSKKEAGYRLGCVATVRGDLLIYVLEAAQTGEQVVSKAAARPLDIKIDHRVFT